MATPQIQFDQGDTGTPGASRDDLTLGQAVTLSDGANAGTGKWSWSMLARPIGSAAALSSTTADAPTFTPDVEGTYLFKVVYDGREPSGQYNGVGEFISTQGGAAVLVNGFRIPAAGETTQFDPAQGWHPSFDATVRAVAGGLGGLYDISRSITADAGAVEITTPDAGPALHLKHTLDAASVQVATFEGARATPADGDVAYTSFLMANSAGAPTEFARVAVEAEDVTDGTEDAAYRISLLDGGTLIEALRLNRVGTVINEGGDDRNFRIETAASVYGLRIDGATGEVSIGQSAQGAGALSVAGDIDLGSGSILGNDPGNDFLGVGGIKTRSGMEFIMDTNSNGTDDAIRFMRDSPNPGSAVPILDIYEAVGVGVVATLDGVGASDLEHLTVTNTTAAGSGSPEYSPILALVGQGFDTGAAGSVEAKWGLQVRPVEGDPVAAELLFLSSVDGAAYDWRAKLIDDGSSSEFIVETTDGIRVNNPSLPGKDHFLYAQGNGVFLQGVSSASLATSAQLVATALNTGLRLRNDKPLYPDTDAAHDIGLTDRGFATYYGSTAGVGTGTTEGARFENKTDASTGAQEYSPVVAVVGQGFDSGAAASQEVKWGIQARAVEGDPLTSELHFLASINGVAYASAGRMSDDGALHLAQDVLHTFNGDGNDNAGIEFNSATAELEFSLSGLRATLSTTTFTLEGPDLNMNGGQVLADIGAVGSPGIAFAGDTNTGFYQASTNENAIRAAVAGSNVVTVDSGALVLESGVDLLHGERTIVIPAAFGQHTDGSNPNNYFPVGGFTGTRGYLGSSDTESLAYDFPVTPFLRQGDRITQMEIHYQDASPEDITFKLIQVEEDGNRVSPAICNETDTGGGPAKRTITWGPSADGLPYTIPNDVVLFSVQFAQTSSFQEQHFYMVKITYDRP